MKKYCKHLDKDFGEDEEGFPMYPRFGDITVVNGIKFEFSECGWVEID